MRWLLGSVAFAGSVSEVTGDESLRQEWFGMVQLTVASLPGFIEAGIAPRTSFFMPVTTSDELRRAGTRTTG